MRTPADEQLAGLRALLAESERRETILGTALWRLVVACRGAKDLPGAQERYAFALERAWAALGTCGISEAEAEDA